MFVCCFFVNDHWEKMLQRFVSQWSLRKNCYNDCFLNDHWEKNTMFFFSMIIEEKTCYKDLFLNDHWEKIQRGFSQWSFRKTHATKMLFSIIIEKLCYKDFFQRSWKKIFVAFSSQCSLRHKSIFSMIIEKKIFVAWSLRKNLCGILVVFLNLFCFIFNFWFLICAFVLLLFCVFVLCHVFLSCAMCLICVFVFPYRTACQKNMFFLCLFK